MAVYGWTKDGQPALMQESLGVSFAYVLSHMRCVDFAVTIAFYLPICILLLPLLR